MENNFVTGLQELEGSGFKIAPGVADITAWRVLDQRGEIIGDINGLLFDAQEGLVRYLIIALNDQAEYSAKRIIVPTGLAETQPSDRNVILPGVSDGQIAQLPAYPAIAELNPDFELTVKGLLEGHSQAPYEHPQFYSHQHFNEDRFYQTTNLADEPAEAAEARAGRASRIVAKLNHHDEIINKQQNQTPMETSEKALDVINDLIKINNDRVAGFEKAGTDLEGDDNGLIAVFNKLAGESQQYVAELTDIIQRYGDEPVEGTSTSGDLHRAWIDIKATFTGSDLLAIPNECERGEDAAKSAYRDALDPENELSPELIRVLQLQKQGITEGHDLIKSLRDQVETNDDADDENDNIVSNSEPGFQITGASVNPASQGFTPQPSFESAAGEYNREAALAPEPESVEQEEEWQQEQTVGTGDSKLMEFFINELKDLLWAERELAETLPEMAEAATSAELKSAFEMHLTETETHVSRLEQIFGVLGLEVESRKCDAMAGILDEGDEIISATEDGTAQRDVGLIFAGQKAEHYEIASYGGMIALAKTLGYYEIAETLVLTLDEEKTADAKLTEIAENQANYAASTERTED